MSDANRPARGPSGAVHRPVLLREVIRTLELGPGLIVVDGTVGAGGHSREILKHITATGTLIGLDRDPMMLRFASEALPGPNVHLQNDSYRQLSEVLNGMGISRVDRILLDLGLSSDQIADESRGFSFHSTGPLDLRFDASSGIPAWELLETIDEDALKSLLQNFGEERYSGSIARSIARCRTTRHIRTAGDLVHAVEAALPVSARKSGGTHPATRVFQALRIAVNDELGQLETALDRTTHESLAPGGVAAVITFHSGEDKLVKQAFRRTDRWQNLTPKPLTPSAVEKRMNPRCRTAKLRAARKI